MHAYEMCGGTLLPSANVCVLQLRVLQHAGMKASSSDAQHMVSCIRAHMLTCKKCEMHHDRLC